MAAAVEQWAQVSSLMALWHHTPSPEWVKQGTEALQATPLQLLSDRCLAQSLACLHYFQVRGFLLSHSSRKFTYYSIDLLAKVRKTGGVFTQENGLTPLTPLANLWLALAMINEGPPPLHLS